MDTGEGDFDPSPASLLIPSSLPVVRAHINKRALRDKSLAVSFNDKALSDFVGGFQKRKKKRRKEAQRQLQEKERRVKIENRKKRKLEKELALHGGVLPEKETQGDETNHEDGASDSDANDASASGTQMYNTGDMTITVTTTELSHEDEDLTVAPHIHVPNTEHMKKPSLPVKKPPLKKVAVKKPLKRAVVKRTLKKRQKHASKGNVPQSHAVSKGKKSRNKK